jgi:hypothetical protein
MSSRMSKSWSIKFRKPARRGHLEPFRPFKNGQQRYWNGGEKNLMEGALIVVFVLVSLEICVPDFCRFCNLIHMLFAIILMNIFM